MGRAPFALALAVLLMACTNDLDRVAAVEVVSSGPDRVTTGAEYFHRDSGRVVNRLRAGRIEEYRTAAQRRTVMSNDVVLVFFDAHGDEGSRLTARRGLILPDERRMEVSDEVVFVNAKGERLETEHLVWYQDSARIFTDRPVRVVRGTDAIHGLGLEAAEDFSRYRIRNVTGTFHVERGDTLAPDAPDQ